MVQFANIKGRTSIQIANNIPTTIEVAPDTSLYRRSLVFCGNALYCANRWNTKTLVSIISSRDIVRFRNELNSCFRVLVVSYARVEEEAGVVTLFGLQNEVLNIVSEDTISTGYNEGCTSLNDQTAFSVHNDLTNFQGLASLNSNSRSIRTCTGQREVFNYGLASRQSLFDVCSSSIQFNDVVRHIVNECKVLLLLRSSRRSNFITSLYLTDNNGCLTAFLRNNLLNDFIFIIGSSNQSLNITCEGTTFQLYINITFRIVNSNTTGCATFELTTSNNNSLCCFF